MQSIIRLCRAPILLSIFYWILSSVVLQSYHTTAWIHEGCFLSRNTQRKSAVLLASVVKHKQQSTSYPCRKGNYSLKFYNHWYTPTPLSIDGILAYRHTEINNSNSIDSNSTGTSNAVWEVGNVEDDFDNLERAIMYKNADQNLYHEERLEALDYFSQQRVPVRSSIRKGLLTPLLVSFLVSRLLQTTIHCTSNPSIVSAIALLCHRAIRVASIAQFWSLIVLSPTILLCFKCYRTKVSTSTSIQPADSGSGNYNNLRYLLSISDSMNVRTESLSSTRDIVKCLLEQWVSCTAGVTLSGLVWLLSSFVNRGIAKLPKCSMLIVQMCARVAVMASLRQYQSLWFALNRKQQPFPLHWTVWMTQILTDTASNIWFVYLDLITLSLVSPITQKYLPTVVMAVALSWYSIVMSERILKDNKNIPGGQAQQRFSVENVTSKLRKVSRITVTAFIVWSVWSCRTVLSKFLHLLFWKFSARTTVQVFTYRMPTLTVIFLMSLSAALLGPVCHLLACIRLFHVSYSHNASLAMNSNQLEETTKAFDGLSWRFKLRWREPQRIHDTLRNWWGKIMYWLFIRGSVDEKLRQEKQRELRGNGAKARGLTLLQRVAAEHPNFNSFGKDRTQWKINAMKRIAQKHQDDYDRGTYSDPLGVAVYRTLGIGLGFNFDHMNALSNTTVPSIRRLQSRAAKSAVRRVNDIYNTELVRVELEQIEDLVERQQRASILQQEAESEVKKLADRLTELLPPDLLWDELDSELKVQQLSSGSSIQSQKHKIKMPSIESESPALSKLVDSYFEPSFTNGESHEVDYLNPMGTNKVLSDDKFLMEWYKNNRALGNTSSTLDGESTIDTILV